jgi:hypothetical protein
MISTDTHQQFNRALKPAIAKPFPEAIRNNTTIMQLGLADAPMEIFPHEVFFKGTCNRHLTRFRHRALPELRGHGDHPQHHQEPEALQVLEAPNFQLSD